MFRSARKVANPWRPMVVGLVASLSIGHASSLLAAGRVFYDGFESGNTSLWSQDGTRNRCQVVTTSADGVAGPFAGTNMARCNYNGAAAWNDPASFETLTIAPPYTNELFYRVRFRIDTNFQRTPGSPAKLLRIFQTSPAYNDLFESAYSGPAGLVNEDVVAGSQGPTYWGGSSGDNTNKSTGWHKVEYYLNASTGTIRVWHDGVKVREDVKPFGTTSWTPFYMTSNFSDAHGTVNYIYFDEVEVFSDTGTGASGQMSDASVSASGSPPPQAPSNLRATGS